MESTRRSPDSIATLSALLEYRARNFADDIAYRFLQDGEQEARRLSYRELAQRARAIAARMRLVSQPGDRALLLYHPGIEFVEAFWACTLAGTIAVPISAARIRRDQALLQGVFEDSTPGLLLGTRETLTAPAFLSAHQDILHRCILQITDEVESADPAIEPEAVGENNLALLQYTSGSTASPKGVMVRHANLLTNASTFYDGFALHDASVMLSWLPHFHDMGLIGKIIQAVYAGIPCILMAPTAFIQKPARWLAAISRHGVTISGAPNFAYDYCVRRIKDEEMAGLDLSTWEVAFNGSEPVRAGTLEEFQRRFAAWGLQPTALYPCYGLAEATLFVSAPGRNKKPRVRSLDQAAFKRGLVRPAQQREPDYRIVSCGHTWGQDRVRIVDPETHAALPENSIGEIWVDGPSKATGYWCKEELNRSVFQAQIRNEPAGAYLRTGDLGFIQGEDLYITGRRKDIIICRGENYYPQDIEGMLEQELPELTAGSGAAFSVNRDGEEELVIVYEVNREAHRRVDASLLKRITGAVSEAFQLAVADAVLIRPASIPKTTSGKIRRSKVKASYLDGTLVVLLNSRCQGMQTTAAVASGTGPSAVLAEAPAQDAGVTPFPRTAEQIAAWIQDWMAHRLQIATAGIDTTEPFSSYGIDSVTAVELIEALASEYSLADRLEPTALWRYPDIDALVSYILRVAEQSAAGMPPQADKDAPRPGGGVTIAGQGYSGQ